SPPVNAGGLVSWILRRITEEYSAALRIVPSRAQLYRWNVLHDLSFHVVGVSHHPATAGVGGQFAFRQEEVASLLAYARAGGRRPVVVLGAGEAAEGVLRSLHLQGAKNVALVNRNPERAAVLAAAWGAAARGWDELPELMAAADLLLVATGAARPVLSAAQLA